MSEVVRRYGWPLTAAMAAVTMLWILLLVVLPYFVMLDFSFRHNLLPGDVGGPKDVHTLENYAALAQSGLHAKIFLKTVWSSTLATALSLVVCYPIAFHLAKSAPPRRAALMLLLLIIPFWINEILRSFAWFIILAYQGPLNWLLVTTGLTAKPLRLMSGDTGVLVGMVYAYILFMVFPIYNAIESLDKNQIEAARDLGASPWKIHSRIVIPHAKPGIAVGCIMVFVLAASSYAIPAILGSTNSFWFTQVIYQLFFEGQNWPRGSAYAFSLLALCLLFIALLMRLFRVKLVEVVK